MSFLVMTWLLFGFLSFGPAAFIYVYMKKGSKKPWPTTVDSNYKPRVSIIVPTYNESRIILFKLINLSRLTYPKNLIEEIVVDSNSSDNTLGIVKEFSEREPQINMKVLVEEERKGKSHALNWALDHCSGDVIIVSDADCFWSPDILEKALPFLADPKVGAISGPKILLNSTKNWVTKMEKTFLRSANVLRLGESKNGSTVFFEGGFSAFKREALDKFDPYGTGSDDCGTLIGVMVKNFRAMLVPEAAFFSAFPESFRGKIAIKLRRTNQLVRVFSKYLGLLKQRKIKIAKRVIIPNAFLFLFSPIAFLLFILLTMVLLWNFPFLLITSALLLIPQARFYFFQVFESNLMLFTSICLVSTGQSYSIWRQPNDRVLITEELLGRLDLI